jgi:hypothetical protein
LCLNSNIAQLWRQVFGEPLAIVAPTPLVISVLVGSLKPAPPYTPHAVEPASSDSEGDA